MNSLFFNYDGKNKIRFKKSNLYQSDEYPYLYRIKTKRLDFVVPKSMTLMTKDHAYIPLDYYRNVLTTFYKLIKR